MQSEKEETPPPTTEEVRELIQVMMKAIGIEMARLMQVPLVVIAQDVAAPRGVGVWSCEPDADPKKTAAMMHRAADAMAASDSVRVHVDLDLDLDIAESKSSEGDARGA